MKHKLLLSIALVMSLFGGQLFAQADFQITELFFGLSGDDGTEDWIEITNFGDAAGDTGTLFYDDESADITAAGNLDSFILSPGETAVFLLDDNTAAIDEFNTIWSGVANVGLTNGGGGLGQNDDTAFLLDAGGGVIESVAYGAGLENIVVDTEVSGTLVIATVQANLFGTATSTSLADAVLSAEFFNDNLNGTRPNLVRLAGNPGLVTIPEPSMGFALAGLALCALGRRRK